MDEPPRHRRLERKSGSSSRSPSLSRRPSLKDKKVPGTITKVKGKKSGASGSKREKERWLLTRKTWRYMSDAVGNLLPESHRGGGGIGGSTAAGPSSSQATTSTTRRTSSSDGAGPSSPLGTISAGFLHSHSADIPGGVLATGSATRPKSMPSAIPAAATGQGGSGSGSGSKASSTVTSPTYGGIMSFPSHRPGVTPTGPGPGKMFSQTSQSQQVLVATEKFYPPSDDIPTLEKHFDAVCSKEKRFLLWTRTKPKGLSGPALRELKMKQKEGKSAKSKKSKEGASGHRDSSGSIFEALQMKLQLGGSSGAGNKENIHGGEYYSPTTEEEDDYDEYDYDEVTVRERRKSSTASSTMSLMGGGGPPGSLPLFRQISALSSHGSESSYSMILTPYGISKICRNTGTQTDPFPEELLIRFRLRALQEERQLEQRQFSPDGQSDSTTVESNPMSPVRLDTTQKRSSPPPTTTASSPMSPTSTDGGGAGRGSSGSGRESQEKLLETGSSTRPSISGQSDSMATTKSGEGASSPTADAAGKDKKSSEESGYSSSISDTVMRYFKILRKNSKADNKDTIDKFKTVNYDRSLRNIKSKNVSVEEALLHEKNKQAAAEQAKQAAAAPPPPPTLKQQTNGARVASPQQPQQQTQSPPPSEEIISGGSDSGPISPELPVEKVATEDETNVNVSATESVVTSVALPVEPVPLSPTSSLSPGSISQAGDGMVTTTPEQIQEEAASLPSSSSTTTTTQPTVTGLVEGEETKLQEGILPDSELAPSSLPPPAPPLSPTRKGSDAQQGSQLRPQSQEIVGPSSVGIQAGESLVRFLRNLNSTPLARKMSDFSSSCCSSESPAEVFSPRYSFATTVMSGSDTEMFGGGLQQAAMASMMAMASTKGMRASGPMGIPQPAGGIDAPSEFDDVFQGMRTSFFQKSQQSQQATGGPLSSSWTGSSTVGGSAPTREMKKSSSVQQMVSFSGDLGSSSSTQTTAPPITTTSGSSSYSLSGLFHYSPTKSFRAREREHISTVGGGGSSTPVTPVTSSMGGGSGSGGLMKSFFGSSPFSSTFGLKKSNLRKPTSTTSLTITTNTGSDSMSGGRGNMGSIPPPTTSSSPNLLSLIQSSAASAGSSFSNLFTSSRGGVGGSGSSVTSASQCPGREFQQSLVTSSSGASSSGELRAQDAYPPLYSRSSLPLSSGSKSGLVGGHLHHNPTHHHHHQHALVSTSGPSTFMAKGLSDFLFAHGHTSPAGKRGSARSTVDLYLSPSGVMQKSKSSSSVLPLYGSSGSVSGAPGGSSSSTAHLRTSPSGSIGGGGGDGLAGPTDSTSAAAGAAQPSSSGGGGGSRLISKSKLFKSRSKSSTRAPTSSSGSAVCTWSPQGRCKWKSVSGKLVILEPTNVLILSDVERLTLQDVALEKLRALNLGVDVKIPKEKVGGGQQKPKRRPYLLKKKALSTGFFESGSKREEAKESTGGGSGLVFGISLSQCVTNDRLRQMKASASTTQEWELQQGAGSQQQKRSQNGSRNSVSSVFEMPKEDKDPLQPPGQSPTGSSVPVLVTACIAHLENYGLHTTGIFRVSTSLKRIRQLREDIDSGKEIQFGEDHSPHDVAALLKEFLRDLPEPLLCRDLYQAFLKTQKIRNRKLQLEAIQHLVQLLPVSNRDTLAALLKFFAQVVANSSETRSKTGELLPGNKMEGYSLATLIAPNILPCMPTEGASVVASASSMDQNAALTKERRESIDLVNYMISNYGAIFDVTPELLHDVYLHLMDTNPEAIEGILRQRCGVPDDGVDELDTTSSVFEESEGGELLEPEESVTSTTPTTRVYRRREDILHEGAGKGGGDDTSTKERFRGRRGDDGGGGTSSDVEKQTQSGGESDSSIGTRSTSRWFRRSRGDAKGRTSSDSGSEKVKGSSRKRESSLFEAKRANSLDSVNVPEPPPGQSTRVSPRSSAVVTGVGASDLIPGRTFSGSDQSLRVPEHLVNTRRQSSPVLESSGIITASLKIPVPVPLNIDDTDIPYIEDENNADGGWGAPITHPYHHHHHHLVHQHQPHQHQPQPQLYPQGTSSMQQKYPQSIYQYPASPPVGEVRCRSMSTDSSIPLKTTSSSVTTTPISSPPRQPSSEVSSPTGFSPPTSPPLYGTFPVEEMTARMLIGSGASSTPSTMTALSTSPSMHQFHHGAITMTTPSSSSTGGYQYPSMSVAAKETSLLPESRSAGSTPVTKPKIEKGGSSPAGMTLAAAPSSTSSRTSLLSSSQSPQKPGAIASLGVVSVKSGSPSPQPPVQSSTVAAQPLSSLPPSTSPSSGGVSPSQTQGTTPSSIMMPSTGEPKGLGKETKGANIGRLIKSKTADFEKLSTTKGPEPGSSSSAEPTPTSGEPVPGIPAPIPSTPAPSQQSHTHHQIYSIAPKMRLRSQENVLLKQQFLMRQQQQHQEGGAAATSTLRRERTSQKGTSEESPSTSSSSLPTSTDQRQPSGPTGGADESIQHPSGRGLQRRRLVGSSSSSAIMSCGTKSSSSSSIAAGGSSSISSTPHRVRSRESTTVDNSHLLQIQPPPASGIATTSGSTVTATTATTSPSRWKRSEIIASRQQSQSSSDPETFV